MNLESYTKAQRFDLTNLTALVDSWRPLFEQHQIDMIAWIPEEPALDQEVMVKVNKLVCYAFERLQQVTVNSEERYLSVFVQSGSQTEISIKDNADALSANQVEQAYDWIGDTQSEVPYLYDAEEGNIFKVVS